MGRGKALTSDEKGKIIAYKECKLTYREIAEKIGKSKSVVCNFLKNTSGYGKNIKGRTKKKLSGTDERRILREASNSHCSASKIRTNLEINASVDTVRRVIRKAKHLKRLKLKKKPPLNNQRKDSRIVFARNHMTWKAEWHTVVFSDEKRFNLDGPDGFNFYFHDIRKEEHFLSRHHSREKGVMVWGAISYYGTCQLQFVSSKMNATHYKGLLEKAFPDFNNIFGPLPWTFQQDNAPIHTARVVKSWIQEQNVTLMEWPPYSPDLNIIENVWGWMTRKVYESGRQFEDIQSLTDAINTAWREVSLNYLKSLYDSLTDRIYEVISKNGGSTHY